MLMRKLSLILLCLSAWLGVCSQPATGTVTVTPRIGMIMAKYSGDKIYYYDVEEKNVGAKFKPGLFAGVEAQRQMTDIFALGAGLIYSRQGTKFDVVPDYGTFHMSTDNLLVPITVVATSRIGVSFKLGLQPEIRLSDGFDRILNRVVLTVPVAVAYSYKHFEVDLRYHHGLTSVYTDDSPHVNHRGIVLTLGYGIDL